MEARQVDAHRVGLAVMHLGGTLINICGQTEQIQQIDTSKTHTGHTEFLMQLMKQGARAYWNATTLMHSS